MAALDFATLMPLHAAALAALESGDDPTDALSAFVQAFPAGMPTEGAAHTFLSTLISAACTSPFPGALAHLQAADFFPQGPHESSDDDQPTTGTLVGSAALRGLHTAQVDAFVALVAPEMARLRDAPTGAMADDWFLFATQLPAANDLCMAFGLSHNQKANMDPDVDGPFTVYPQPRDALDRARAAALALATRRAT